LYRTWFTHVQIRGAACRVHGELLAAEVIADAAVKERESVAVVKRLDGLTTDHT